MMKKFGKTFSAVSILTASVSFASSTFNAPSTILNKITCQLDNGYKLIYAKKNTISIKELNEIDYEQDQSGAQDFFRLFESTDAYDAGIFNILDVSNDGMSVEGTMAILDASGKVVRDLKAEAEANLEVFGDLVTEKTGQFDPGYFPEHLPDGAQIHYDSKIQFSEVFFGYFDPMKKSYKAFNGVELRNYYYFNTQSQEDEFLNLSVNTQKGHYIEFYLDSAYIPDYLKQRGVRGIVSLIDVGSGNRDDEDTGGSRQERTEYDILNCKLSDK